MSLPPGTKVQGGTQKKPAPGKAPPQQQPLPTHATAQQVASNSSETTVTTHIHTTCGCCTLAHANYMQTLPQTQTHMTCTHRRTLTHIHMTCTRGFNLNIHVECALLWTFLPHYVQCVPWYVTSLCVAMKWAERYQSTSHNLHSGVWGMFNVNWSTSISFSSLHVFHVLHHLPHHVGLTYFSAFFLTLLCTSLGLTPLDLAAHFS